MNKLIDLYTINTFGYSLTLESYLCEENVLLKDSYFIYYLAKTL